MTLKYYHKDTKTYFSEQGSYLIASEAKVPIVRGIPRFVASSEYAEAFGVQWNRFKKLQLDSFTGTHYTRERLKRCLGSDVEQVLEDKLVLEAGSGAGRFTEHLASHCKELYTFDLSSAIDANYENNHNENTHFFQGDILNIPFEDEVYDLVICLGVLQHTPSTEKALQELWRVVKPGGKLIADHYHFRWSYYTTVVPFFRVFLKRLPPQYSMKIVKKLVDIFFPLHWKFRHSKILKWILGHISPVLTNIEAFEEKGYEFNKDTAYLETYDALTDYYKRLITKSKLLRILKNLDNVENITIERGGNGWEFRVTKKLG
ncbi:MAG: class I SAM-dependent methyltransferase [Thermaurantimonas sp.]|uniref:class I SAM-dependent methyltransferase n=1 Tax=Thermaurantimonas sp. TaxID=2681568 RepID=UPI00391C19C3